MSKNKKLGLLFLISPICLLIFILVAYAIVNFVGSSMMMGGGEGVIDTGSIGLAEASTVSNAIRIINAVLGLFGVIAVLCLLVGVPLGIYFLAKKEGSEALQKLRLKKPEFASLPDDQLLYICNLSWGAFFGAGIWALGNKLYLWALPYIFIVIIGMANSILLYYVIVQPQLIKSLTSLFSIVNIIAIFLGLGTFVIWIILFIKGRELAWQKGWSGFDEFKQRQKLMARIILVFIIVMAILQGVLNYIIQTKTESVFRDLSDSRVMLCLESCVGNDESMEKFFTCKNICAAGDVDSSGVSGLENLNLNQNAELDQEKSEYEINRDNFYRNELIVRGINPDLNGDGEFDSLDLEILLDPRSDVDGDGLSYEEERLYKTDPYDIDTDGDGKSDKYEIDNGSDPLVAEGTETSISGSSYSDQTLKINFLYPASWQGIEDFISDGGTFHNLIVTGSQVFMAVYDPKNKGIGDRGPGWQDKARKIKTEQDFKAYCQNKTDCTNKTNKAGLTFIKVSEEICLEIGCLQAIDYYFFNGLNQYTTVMLSDYNFKVYNFDVEKDLDYIADNFQFLK